MSMRTSNTYIFWNKFFFIQHFRRKKGVVREIGERRRGEIWTGEGKGDSERENEDRIWSERLEIGDSEVVQVTCHIMFLWTAYDGTLFCINNNPF